MDLPAHYAAMREAALRRFARHEVETDALLDSVHDTRRGLTLLARPPADIAATIAEMLGELRRVEPGQYYYPTTDLHLTILSVISCYPGFALAGFEAQSYCQLVADVLRDTPPFTITLAGFTASPGGILVQGFPSGDGLAVLRTRLRKAFQDSGLLQSIDQRYRLQTAHLTVVRFRSAPLDYRHLSGFLKNYQQQFIGSLVVDNLELVFNDWYQRRRNTVLLARYPLGLRQPRP